MLQLKACIIQTTISCYFYHRTSPYSVYGNRKSTTNGIYAAFWRFCYHRYKFQFALYLILASEICGIRQFLFIKTVLQRLIFCLKKEV